jgi:hypothetical protein
MLYQLSYASPLKLRKNTKPEQELQGGSRRRAHRMPNPQIMWRLSGWPAQSLVTAFPQVIRVELVAQVAAAKPEARLAAELLQRLAAC